MCVCVCVCGGLAWVPFGGRSVSQLPIVWRRPKQGLTITMKKHPGSFKLNGHLVEINERAKASTDKEDVLYEGE